MTARNLLSTIRSVRALKWLRNQSFFMILQWFRTSDVTFLQQIFIVVLCMVCVDVRCMNVT